LKFILLCCHLCSMSTAEIAGFTFGVAGVYLTLKENVWCFPVGLISVAITLFLCLDQKLYADSLQQLVYIALLTYGWFIWLHGSKKNVLQISTSSRALLISCLIIWLCGSFLLGFLLDNYTDASTPWPDSVFTVLSFIAQWLVAKKKIENWLLWIPVNIAYIPIYLYKGLALYAAYSFILLVLAIVGYTSWRKELKLNAG
jgi:nicotinamide mononucleotide transporter